MTSGSTNIDMKKLTLLYISLSGNTENFLVRLENWLTKNTNLEIDKVNVKQLVKDDEEFFKIPNKFICFVPTYLEGGNGVDNGDVEILTTPLREFIRKYNNSENMLGVIGSGNKNFNNQYCLTAKQYSQEFSVPFLADFELRGTDNDIERIGQIIVGVM